MEILPLVKEKSFWCRSTNIPSNGQILFRHTGEKYGELTSEELEKILIRLQRPCSPTTWTLISCTCSMFSSCEECLFCSMFQKCGRLRRMFRWLGRMMVTRRTRAPGQG